MELGFIAKRVAFAALALIVALSFAVIPHGTSAAYAASSGQQLAASSMALQSNASSRYKIKTPYYSLTVPKVWRGKVQWSTSSTYVRQYKVVRSGQYGYSQYYTGKRYKTYHTTFYLKGHKGDQRYWLATVGGERNDCDHMTGWGSHRYMVADDFKGKRFIYLLAANMPGIIGWYYKEPSQWVKDITPSKVSDQKKMLKLTVGNRVSYAKAKKSGATDSKLQANVAKYLGPKFKKTLKMKK